MTTTPAQIHAHSTELLNRARRIIPALATARTLGTRLCVRPLPIDGLPIVGWCRPGLYVAVTHSGITLAPHLARLITREILDEVPAEELIGYRPDRVPAAVE